jgi:hypothetical protein
MLMLLLMLMMLLLMLLLLATPLNFSSTRVPHLALAPTTHSGLAVHDRTLDLRFSGTELV